MRPYIYFLAFSAFLLTAEPACSADEHEHSKENGAHVSHERDSVNREHEEQSIKLNDKLIKEMGIAIETAEPGPIPIAVSVPGETVVNEEKLSHISARFPGIVKDVKKRVGDHVKAGDVLALVESNESLSLYNIKSLIDGIVIAKHATLGELLKEDDIAFSVADLSSVWINLSIYQIDLPKVRQGQVVKLSTGHNVTPVLGEISYLSPVVDERTRTAVARVVLDNRDGSWRPGLFVTGEITLSEQTAAVRVPTTSLHYIDQIPHIFVRTKDGFRAEEVSVGEKNESFVEILSGVSPGEHFAADHSFVLKAEMEKGSFGHGHSH
ncbi:MAG: efflux RND transporter periplasmic adaptor subunit [Bdellovibrionales bacterium]|nr:efflux RND transporter periplasmic adaptor subunit [Bdellovibrionales bacterium]